MIFKVPYIGGGDIKLAAAIGSMVGLHVLKYLFCFALAIALLQVIVSLKRGDACIVPSVGLHAFALGLSLFLVTSNYQFVPFTIYVLSFIPLVVISNGLGVSDWEQVS